MVSEDFSFPKITNVPIPHFTFSPSLWRVSSLVYPDDFNVEDNQIQQKHSKNPKSFSFGFDWDNKEEKMDLLWEDFNEELVNRAPVSNSSACSKRSEGSDQLQRRAPSGASAGELYCLQVLKASETGNGRGRGFQALTKAFKKIFLLRNRSVGIKKK